jgi:WD40 repeat protein
VDAQCIRFEAAWKATGATGGRPSLEEYLADTPEPERFALLVELIRVEVHYRRQLGETPCGADYVARFPRLEAARLGRAVTVVTGASAVAGTIADNSAAPRESVVERPEVAGYEILHVLGRGGMGVVYQARHVKLNRTVALKMILAGGHAQPGEVARFRTEAAAVARLQHPHIVQIHEVGEQEGRPFLSLELVDGGSLAQRISDTPLPAREAAHLVETLSRAMHYAHQQGIIHRDLKPQNVLFTTAGVPKIMDFGLAKRLGEDAGLTRTGEVLGTPSYMAPEQTTGEPSTIGPVTDVYALGALLYEVLTGRPPFKAATVLETLEQVRFQEPVPPGRLQPNLPHDLETICLKCLEKEAHKRYASAEDLAEDLRRFQAGETTRARPVRALERGVKWARRRPAVAALLAVSFVAALALVGMLVGLFFNWRLQGAFEDVDQARLAADQARQAELGQKKQAETNLYFHRLLLAEHEWSANNVVRAEQLLDQCPAGVPHGWEWHYLKRLCHTELRTLRGHDGQVEKATFSPDGRWIASVGEDKLVRVWDAATGQVVHALSGHADRLYGVVFSADSLRIASVSGGFDKPGEVIVWNAATGAKLHTLPARTGLTASVAFSRDGGFVAAASGERGDRPSEIQIWDATTGKELHTIHGRQGEGILNLIFSPDGKHLVAAIGTWDIYNPQQKPGVVRGWSVLTGAEAFILVGHSGPVTSVAFNSDGSRLASASWDQTVRVWDATNHKELLVLRGHRHFVGDVAFSRDDSRIASASQDGSAKIWNGSTGQELLTLRGHDGPFASVAFSPDNKQLVTAGDDGTVKLWDATASKEALTLSEHGAWVTSVALSRDGQRLASGSVDRTVMVWDVATGRRLLTLGPQSHSIWGVAFSPDNRWIATASGDWPQAGKPGVVQIWDAASGQKGRTLTGHNNVVWSVEFSPDGLQLASAGGELTNGLGAVKVWDPVTGRQLLDLQSPDRGFSSLAFSSDGARLAASTGSMVQVWEAPRGKSLISFTGHPGMIYNLAFSPDSRRICTAGADNKLRLWDAATGKETCEPLRGHTHYIQCVAFSPDGRRLASASVDQTVKLWDVATGQEVITLRGHTGAVWSVAFSPDGNRLVSASQDRTVKIWDATPMKEEPLQAK